MATESWARARTLSVFVSLVIAIGSATILHAAYKLPEAPDPIGWFALGVLAIGSAAQAKPRWLSLGWSSILANE